MSEITPAEKLASVLFEYDDGGWYAEPLNGWVTTEAKGDTVHLKVAHHDEAGEVVGQAQHFRAVVVEGETVPIVLPRPDLQDGLAFEGEPYDDDDTDGWQVSASASNGRPTQAVFADSILFRGAPGHISLAEARRFAAALVAMADAVEAAQAEQSGGAS